MLATDKVDHKRKASFSPNCGVDGLSQIVERIYGFRKDGRKKTKSLLFIFLLEIWIRTFELILFLKLISCGKGKNPIKSESAPKNDRNANFTPKRNTLLSLNCSRTRKEKKKILSLKIESQVKDQKCVIPPRRSVYQCVNAFHFLSRSLQMTARSIANLCNIFRRAKGRT